MSTYIVLGNWTEKGFHDIESSPDRLEEFKQLCKENGATLVSFYVTMGPYDMVIIVDAPDDAVIGRLTLLGGKGGATRTLTLKAFSEDEFRKIVSSLG